MSFLSKFYYSQRLFWDALFSPHTEWDVCVECIFGERLDSLKGDGENDCDMETEGSFFQDSDNREVCCLRVSDKDDRDKNMLLIAAVRMSFMCLRFW